ncbi:BTAD domain-containing putative transcriptional regulator [Nonomuraea sp. C10]|uniref:BTAD domain-containing putative transcriptional regulator n=1 Tax=Nonomuraea sp. C10 TaxID=2600577 RepID=UPI0011CE1D92|nr:BTAD domain-containing putative transcriptional regulator [Nonomuraea sp. C10]TXK39453.1 AfsR/SARP family transcriptional regulator [Nonomuraea sp. C10]
MRFRVLGPLEVRRAAGEPVSVPGRRPRALLVMLLLGAGRPVAVQDLIDGQYGADPPAGAANAVQAQVSRLRRVLEPGLIGFTGAGYRLDVDPDDVDVHRFERLVRQGRRAAEAGDPPLAASLLREGLALWREPPLADLPSAVAAATRLEDLRVSAAEDLAEAELGLPGGPSVGELRRLVAAHPLRERLRALLVRALAAQGRQAEALGAFEEGRRLLADELGVDPSGELAAAHLAVLRGPESAPPAGGGLPARLTSFVGRERELHRLAALRGSRLVTVVGSGGTGKTRLAVEAASRDPLPAFFADLSTLPAFPSAGSTPSVGEVARVVLWALGAREGGLRAPGGGDPVRRLVAALAGRPALLVLDNCEHVVEAAAELVRALLDECPDLRILATGREALGITGEARLDLAPLGLPPREDSPVRDALRYPAVRLFAERAAAVRSGFAVDEGNVADVVRVCAALDGIPLAIELAAARLRAFGVREVARRLAEDGRFLALDRGERGAVGRHRTLRAAVEWSWSLLTPDERAVAARFSVFTGGAALEAVLGVCGPDAADALEGLVDKSLVLFDGDRYRMLETIREFCAGRLDRAGERERVRERHAGWFEGMAREADPWLRRGEQIGRLRLLSADHGNLMAALTWAVRHDRPLALRLVSALATYWWLSGRQSQAASPAAALLDGPVEGLEEEYVLCVVHAAPLAGREHWARAEAYIRGFRRPLRNPFTAALWGMTVGPFASGVRPADDRVLGSDPWSMALGRLGWALVRWLDGEPRAAERELEAVLALFRQVGERWGTAQALDALATIAGRRGEWARARELWREALELLDELGALEETADVLAHRAEAFLREGDPAQALAGYRRAEEAARRAGREVPVPVSAGLAEVALLEGDLREARRLLEAALAASDGAVFGARHARVRVLLGLARLAEAGDAGALGAAAVSGEILAVARDVPLGTVLADAAEARAAAVLAGTRTRPSDTRTAGESGAGEVDAGEPVATPAEPGAGEVDAGWLVGVLLGAAVALRGAPVTGDRHAARTAAGGRALSGAEAFAEAYARGKAMSRQEALALLEGGAPARR